MFGLSASSGASTAQRQHPIGPDRFFNDPLRNYSQDIDMRLIKGASLSWRSARRRGRAC